MTYILTKCGANSLAPTNASGEVLSSSWQNTECHKATLRVRALVLAVVELPRKSIVPYVMHTIHEGGRALPFNIQSLPLSTPETSAKDWRLG